VKPRAIPTLSLADVTVLREWASTRARSDWPAPPDGDGRPAMLMPGFLAGDPSLARMALWLREGGWTTTRSGVRWNVDCMEATLGRVERRLEAAVETSGRRALVIGQSRGGTMGRVLAARRPDLVETLVTLGSPILDQLAVHRRHWVPIGAIGVLGTVGVPGFFGLGCLRGDCCTLAHADLGAPFPNDVRYLAFFTRSDEVVRWQVCVEPAAKGIEVATTHIGMGMDAGVWRQLGLELSEPPAAADELVTRRAQAV
jgi:triacylglycerol lipase